MSYFPAPIPQPVTATAGDFAVTAVGIVGVTQATSPWVTTSTISGISTVTGTVFATLAGTSVVAGIVSATQGTSPWIVAGTVSATQGTSPWVVSAAAIGATQSGVWAVNSTVTSIPGVGPTGTTAPTTAIVNGIIVSGTLQAVSSTFPMPVSGALSATQGTSPWVISAAAIGATQATSPWTTTATITGTPTVTATITGTPAVTSTILGTPTVTATILGNPLVWIEGHAGAIMDGVVTAAAAPANGLVGLLVSTTNTVTTTLANNQSIAVQGDYVGNTFVRPYRRSQLSPAQLATLSTTTAQTLFTAGAAGVYKDISNLVITPLSQASTSLPFVVNITDGTSTYKFNFLTGMNSISTTQPGVTGHSLAVNFNPPLPQSTTATTWMVNLNVTTCTCSVVALAVQSMVN